jgi:glycosyltransferase involved in cell wall biosynthesis
MIFERGWNMSNLRVYIAIETFFPLIGGSEKQAFQQGKYLRAQGIEATILTMRFQTSCPGYECLEGLPVWRVAGRVLTWHCRLPGILRRLCYFFALLVLGWRLWSHRHNYDILHVFQLTLFTLPALAVCRLAHKPLVIGMRCDSPRLEQEQPDKRVKSWAGLDGFARLGQPALRLLARELRRPHVQVLVLSAQMHASLGRYGLAAGKLRQIPNGVDTTRFSPGPEQEKQGAPVLCIAKLRYQKGIDLLLHAWRSLVEQVPEARLVIVGDGPLYASLRELADDLGVAASVEFAGLCTDVPAQLRRARIAVLPSRWEGMPNVLLEAMSAGLACVATRVSGSEELLGRDERGLLVEPGDSASLAAALLRLLGDSELVRRYGEAARRHVEQHYAFSSVMRRHIELYTELAESC